MIMAIWLPGEWQVKSETAPAALSSLITGPCSSHACTESRDHGDGHALARRIAMIMIGGYSPRQTGGRFSAKAVAPSLASAEKNTGPAISACRSNDSDCGQSADSTTIRLV